MPTKPHEMMTIAGLIVIPGWAEMAANHRTRATVFQCLTNFVLEYSIPPTKKELLGAVIEQQKATNIPPLSAKSLGGIQDHLDNLVEKGYVFRLGFGQTADTESKSGRRKKGRGGPARCFWPTCVALNLKEGNDDHKQQL